MPLAHYNPPPKIYYCNKCFSIFSVHQYCYIHECLECGSFDLESKVEWTFTEEDKKEIDTKRKIYLRKKKLERII